MKFRLTERRRQRTGLETGSSRSTKNIGDDPTWAKGQKRPGRSGETKLGSEQLPGKRAFAEVGRIENGGLFWLKRENRLSGSWKGEKKYIIDDAWNRGLFAKDLSFRSTYYYWKSLSKGTILRAWGKKPVLLGGRGILAIKNNRRRSIHRSTGKD